MEAVRPSVQALWSTLCLRDQKRFLRHVVRSPAFAHAQLDTAMIEREKAVLFHQNAVPTPLAVAAAVAQQLHTEQAQQGADPFSRRDGWHSHASVQRRFALVQAGEPLEATLTYGPQGSLQLQWGRHKGRCTGKRKAMACCCSLLACAAPPRCMCWASSATSSRPRVPPCWSCPTRWLTRARATAKAAA